ncbi:hypothetical protein PJZ01_000867 [Listeria innocua]|nr:hypothetical protein [Listeria innocua]EKJ8909829.1 hypothetical protein [Listeria innocua]EKJ8914409.1 hypothetical protein [Listeria innocua]EKJ8928668.1 hypothetical protein [Listeria innocua]EKJ8949033.1 hypothetical protein [Listeria innocua]
MKKIDILKLSLSLGVCFSLAVQNTSASVLVFADTEKSELQENQLETEFNSDETQESHETISSIKDTNSVKEINDEPIFRRNAEEDLANGIFGKILQSRDGKLGWEIGSYYIWDFTHTPVSQSGTDTYEYFLKQFKITDVEINSVDDETISVEKMGNLKYKFTRTKKNISGEYFFRANIDYSYDAQLWFYQPLHAGGERFVKSISGEKLTWGNPRNLPFPLELEVAPALLLEKYQQEKTVELDSSFKQVATDFFKVNQSAGQVSSEITQYPDFSQVGKTHATIKVWDEYNSPQTFDVPFNVVDTRELKVETISQDIRLGEDITLHDSGKSIKKVMLGSKELASNEYTVKWGSNLNSNDIVGERTWPVTITTKDGKHSLDVNLPFTVKWGSTVLLKGYGDDSIGAITLHPKDGNNVELTDSVGIVRNPNEIQVHKGFIGKTYYDLRLLGVSDTAQKLKSLKPVTKENSLTWSNGDWNAQDRINAFGDNSNQKQEATVGDILEVTHEEANVRERLIVNEKETQENAGQKLVYYELTKSGFSPLRANQLKAKESTIPLDSNNEYLNQHIKDYIDLKGYSNIEIKEFSSFPKTDKTGKTSGKIIVEETLKSGKRVQWEYEVPFIVKAELSAEAVSTSVNLGTDSISIDSMVKNVKLGNRELSKGEYEVALKNKVDTSTVGIKPTIVVVSAEGEKVEVRVSVTVKWGSTVLLKGYGDDSVGAITLHQKDGNNVELTDSVGIVRNPDEVQVHKSFIGESYYDVRLLGVSDTVQKLTSLDPVTEYNSLAWAHGEANAEAIINKFGDNSNGRQEAEVGNILEVTHAEANGRERLIVNEKETQENNGQNLVYYELTKNGFSPLRVNQLKTIKSEIPLFSSEQYLNQHIKDYIDLKGYSNIEAKEFSSFPKTNQAGEASGKIVVEETLKSGKKVQWEYEVPFTVLEGSLALSVPKTLTFKEFSSSKYEQIIQRKYSGDLGLTIKDSRGGGKQGGWHLTAKVQKSTTGIAPYLVFSKQGEADQPLTDAATIYSQPKQEDVSEALEVKVSALWEKNEGILLKVPAKSKLESNKTYSETIYWNLVEGP